MTFSIAIVCQKTGLIGYGVTTSSVCVGARVGRIGADCVVFSQARTDARLHEPGLADHAQSGDCDTALAAMKTAGTFLHWRQLGVLSRSGKAAHFTGDSCMAFCGGLTGNGSLALGNFLATEHVMPAMIAAADEAHKSLAMRLIGALQAGLDEGGENDPLQSASLAILGTDNFVETDLRVDKSSIPISDLADLWQDWEPKADAYRIRAKTPDDAPPSSQVEHNHPPN